MTTVRFLQTFTDGALYNPGEEAMFTDVDAAALVQAGIAVVVRKTITAAPDPPSRLGIIRKGAQS